jgi:hypothetical protein
VDPLLCGVTAVGEFLLCDICREGLPVLDLIRTKDPRLKQIRLFWKERGSCSTDMPYHQMAPMLTSALEQCQLNKAKVTISCAAHVMGPPLDAVLHAQTAWYGAACASNQCSHAAGALPCCGGLPMPLAAVAPRSACTCAATPPHCYSPPLGPC